MTDRLDLLLDMLSALPDPVFVLTETGRYAALIGGGDRCHYHNGSFLVDFTLSDVLPRAKVEWFLEQIHLTLAENRLRIVEYGLSGSDVDGLDTRAGPEGEIWFEGRIQPLPTLVNNERAVVWVACNITRRHQLEERLKFLSETDELTGAFNRRKLLETLGQSLVSVRDQLTSSSLMLMDVDHFKSINDRFGHIVGDQVLRGVASHAIANIREEDLFARFGGEEFALLLPNTRADEANLIAQQLCRSIAQMSFSEHSTINVTVSIGVTHLCAKDDSIETILRRADEALYSAKRSGRNCCVTVATPC